MNQEERLDYLIEAFKTDSVEYKTIQTPTDTAGKKKLLRSLMNIRMPAPLPEEVIEVQDEYLSLRSKEIGVGANTPVIIKYPFWQMTYDNPKAVYACLNFNEAFCPEQISDRSICINGDIFDILMAIEQQSTV